ncbi:MAG: transposase, partial [bacterium]|nr:transposase [bacterium]
MADVLRRYGDAYQRTHRVPPSRSKVIHAITSCRTAALGGHREKCPRCDFVRYSYNSCRNRHCPKCQAVTKARWLADRQAELLPAPYFHNVFTVPHELNGLFLSCEENQREMLNLLFNTVSETLLTFGRNNLGGRIGFTLVLHTWDQQLLAHYHLHCVIAGGALSEDGKHWTAAPSEKFLFDVTALGIVFRAKFLEGLQRLIAGGRLELVGKVADLAEPAKLKRFLNPLWRKGWVVYSKRPFGGPKKVLDYLGRYTHRVAISNNRLISADGEKVRFFYRDRTAGDVLKVC